MRQLTCLVRDDFTNLLLLYRKLVSTNYDDVAIYTAYNKKSQKFVLDSDLLKSFPGLTYIGPTPIYEDYITYANFPVSINLEDYNENFININMVEHLKTTHIDDIFPAQKTAYHHSLHITPDFEIAKSKVDTNKVNICINVFDPVYDQNFSLHYNIIYCLSELQNNFNNIEVHLVGIQHEDHVPMISNAVTEALDSLDNIKLHNHLFSPFSEQVGILLHSDGLISCPFGLGILAYTIGISSFIIYPFHLENLVGKTIDPNKPNVRYIETTDTDYISDIDNFIKLIGEVNDRNRNNNT
jgi:hypothetical protein